MAGTREFIRPKTNREDPNTIPVSSSKAPLRWKFPSEAIRVVPLKAPIPPADKSRPKPVSPALKILFAKTGISVIQDEATIIGTKAISSKVYRIVLFFTYLSPSTTSFVNAVFWFTFFVSPGGSAY